MTELLRELAPTIAAVALLITAITTIRNGKKLNRVERDVNSNMTNALTKIDLLYREISSLKDAARRRHK
jgi:hypothetical protein